MRVSEIRVKRIGVNQGLGVPKRHFKINIVLVITLVVEGVSIAARYERSFN